MKYNYQNISISKDFYKSAEGFSKTLERLDPSEQYRGTELAGYDAFQRQLKRFDIKVAGADSDRLQKFFATSDSAALFPEYVSRAVKQGVDDNHILEEICAAHTQVEGMDYRAVASDPDWETQSPSVIEEGGFIPETTIHLKDSLIRLRKRGRMMVASYEAIKFQRLDLFTVALKQIGACIGKAQLQDAVDVLINGDGNNNPAGKVDLAAKDTLTYADLLNLWNSFGEYQMNVMLASPDMMLKLLQVEELQDPQTGLNFQATGSLSTPLGAKLFVSSAVPAGTIIGLDKRYALEMVSAGGVNVEYDKLIDCQLERAAVTSIAGFSKIFADAVKVLSNPEETEDQGE